MEPRGADLPLPLPLAAVIPCYNGGTRLRPVVEAVIPYVLRVIVVDDGSTDGGVDAVRSLPVDVVAFESNQGKGFALIEGLKAALRVEGAEALVTLDADGQHDPAELPGLFRAFKDGNAGLIIGTRRFVSAEVPWRSRFGNTCTATIARLVLGQPVPDTQSGYRIHSRAFAEAVVRDVTGGRYETEMDILVKAVRERWGLLTPPIATVYEPGNPTSHFQVFRDSWRIYARLVRALLRRPV